MRLGGLELDELKQWISEWLAANEESKLKIGLGKEEALRRAQRLLSQILGKEIIPEGVKLDDEFKEVLYALVYSVTRGDFGDPGNVGAIHDFIRGIRWTDDEFGEREELLNECLLSSRLMRHPTDIAIEAGAREDGRPNAGRERGEAETVFEENRSLNSREAHHLSRSLRHRGERIRGETPQVVRPCLRTKGRP